MINAGNKNHRTSGGTSNKFTERGSKEIGSAKPNSKGHLCLFLLLRGKKR